MAHKYMWVVQSSLKGIMLNIFSLFNHDNLCAPGLQLERERGFAVGKRGALPRLNLPGGGVPVLRLPRRAAV